MVEEIKTEASFLEQVRQEREALEKANADMRQLLIEQRELRAIEILSGKTEAGKQAEAPKKLTPKEYAESIMKGINPD